MRGQWWLDRLVKDRAKVAKALAQQQHNNDKAGAPHPVGGSVPFGLIFKILQQAYKKRKIKKHLEFLTRHAGVTTILAWAGLNHRCPFHSPCPSDLVRASFYRPQLSLSVNSFPFYSLLLGERKGKERKLARVSRPRPAHTKMKPNLLVLLSHLFLKPPSFLLRGIGVGWSKSRPTKLSSYILQGFEGNVVWFFFLFRLPSVCPYTDSCSLEALFWLVLWS